MDNKNTKHTPGPWKVGGPFPSVSVCIEAEPGDSETPPIWEPVCIVDSNTSPPQNERSLADAKLIAAAPKMLETLKAVVEFLEPQACTDCACEGSNPACNMLNEIEQVITEAEGR